MGPSRAQYRFILVWRNQRAQLALVYKQISCTYISNQYRKKSQKLGKSVLIIGTFLDLCKSQIAGEEAEGESWPNKPVCRFFLQLCATHQKKRCGAVSGVRRPLRKVRDARSVSGLCGVPLLRISSCDKDQAGGGGGGGGGILSPFSICLCGSLWLELQDISSPQG